MQQFTTPMMKQYSAIKKQYEDCLLFYRMGDFYELFLDDAYIGAKILNITLTSRPKGKDGRIPMAGVPFHAVDAYLTKLVKAGYKVAICEQTSPPSKRGIIEREVVRIVTPGTITDEKALEKKDNNYVVSLLIDDATVAFSVADISTGYFSTTQMPVDNLSQILKDHFARINASECILPESLYNNPELLKLLKNEKNLNIYCFHDWQQFADDAPTLLKNHFKVGTLAGFGLLDKPLAVITAAALLGYLSYTQKSKVAHIRKITPYETNNFMLLDKSTMINLELFSTIREHDTKGTLLSILDQTTTAMGGRHLKQWIKMPLLEKKQIEERFDGVEELLEKTDLCETCISFLEKIIDIERLLSRLSVGIGNPRDLVNLKFALQEILLIKKILSKTTAPILQKITNTISLEVTSIIKSIEEKIIDEPSIDAKNGGIIRDGVDKQLDALRKIVKNSKTWVKKLEETEREKTGIASLKVRFNQVFGYYIEISKANLSLVPNYFIRKQTLVNGERFITPELKKHEDIILTAEEKMNEIEFTLFSKLVEDVVSKTDIIQNAAFAIAQLDCLINFATISQANAYVRPIFSTSEKIHIVEGRHPVVEKLLESGDFVPNDVLLDQKKQSLLLLTGPNMAGKSVFIRQVALISLMAQIGCFVPAKKAELSLLDKIFVRSGASDVITSGLSTFMVEMVETAYILNHASTKSLIVMDEIGRGTSTYDGISIAWAVAQYLVSHYSLPPKTLFSTHYHELQALEQEYPTKIKNYHMTVEEKDGEPIFLHTILPGGASHSFGISVAKLAGVPQDIIENARELLFSLEKRNKQNKKTQTKKRILNPAFEEIIERLSITPIAKTTPLEALNLLNDLQKKLQQ